MVTKGRGLAFTNTPMTPECTLGLCWRIWGWLHAVPPPAWLDLPLGPRITPICSALIGKPSSSPLPAMGITCLPRPPLAGLPFTAL